MFYLVHTMTLDAPSRRRGWVAIATGKNQKESNFSWDTASYLQGLYSTVMPIKMRSCHITHPSDTLSYSLYPKLKGIIGRDMRLRWKIYPKSTTDEELMEQLASYGIPRTRLPVEIGGELRLDFEQFIADYSVLETLQHMDAAEEKVRAQAQAQQLQQPLSSAAARSTTNAVLSHPMIGPPSQEQMLSTSADDDRRTFDALAAFAGFPSAPSALPGISTTDGNADDEAARVRAQIINDFNSQLLSAGLHQQTSSQKPSSYSSASSSSVSSGLRRASGDIPNQEHDLVKGAQQQKQPRGGGVLHRAPRCNDHEIDNNYDGQRSGGKPMTLLASLSSSSSDADIQPVARSNPRSGAGDGL